MSKGKKIALGVGVIIVVIAVIVAIVLINKERDIIVGPDAHLWYVTGKITEITSDDTVVIEVTKEKTGELKLGDKVTVKYDSLKAELIENENADPTNITEEFEIQVGDEVHLSYMNGTLKRNGDDLSVKNATIEFYLSDLENRTFYERAY